MIANPEWQSKLLRVIEGHYRQAPRFAEVIALVDEATRSLPPSLLSVNVALLRLFSRHILYRPPAIVFESEAPKVDGDLTTRLIAHSKHFGINAVVFGEGQSIRIYDLSAISQAGISVWKQEYSKHHPVYPQLHGPFIGRLSALDAAMCVGMQELAGIINSTPAPLLIWPAWEGCSSQ